MLIFFAKKVWRFLCKIVWHFFLQNGCGFAHNTIENVPSLYPMTMFILNNWPWFIYCLYFLCESPLWYKLAIAQKQLLLCVLWMSKRADLDETAYNTDLQELPSILLYTVFLWLWDRAFLFLDWPQISKLVLWSSALWLVFPF